MHCESPTGSTIADEITANGSKPGLTDFRTGADYFFGANFVCQTASHKQVSPMTDADFLWTIHY